MKGLEMKYFLLNPTKDNVFGEASRRAMMLYASTITEANPQLAIDMEEWILKIREEIALKKPPPKPIFKGKI